jgi:hypothetical protein
MAFLETRAGRRAAARTTHEARDVLATTRDGWRVVSPQARGGDDRCGMTAHRGVLHPDEYVNMAELVPAVEQRLGFTLDELRDVYRQGRLSPRRLELRARVDARFLELRDAGGNLELLARVTGVDRKVIGRGLARGRVADRAAVSFRCRSSD